MTLGKLARYEKSQEFENFNKKNVKSMGSLEKANMSSSIYNIEKFESFYFTSKLLQRI